MPTHDAATAFSSDGRIRSYYCITNMLGAAFSLPETLCPSFRGPPKSCKVLQSYGLQKNCAQHVGSLVSACNRAGWNNCTWMVVHAGGKAWCASRCWLRMLPAFRNLHCETALRRSQGKAAAAQLIGISACSDAPRRNRFDLIDVDLNFVHWIWHLIILLACATRAMTLF